MAHKPYGLSSSTDISNAEAFKFIRDLIDQAQADKYETRIVCEFNDTPCDNSDDLDGYLLIDFSEEPNYSRLTGPTVHDYFFERWEFKDPTLLCYVQTCFKCSDSCVDIHSKQTLITYLFKAWKKGRIADLYAESY